MQSSGLLGYSVRELLERALKLIIAESTTGPAFDKRIDLKIDLSLYDPKLGRKHPVTAKVRITGRSRVLDSIERHE